MSPNNLLQKKRPKVGLALSGGGARGFAHIGVLKVLSAAGYKIDLIAGTSMGAIIGAAYAGGYAPETIEELAIKFSKLKEIIKLLDINPPRKGLLVGNRVKKYLEKIFQEQHLFSDLSIPFGLNAVDLISGREIPFYSGELLPAIMASISIPGIFAPVKLNGYYLVDGGLLNNLPVSIARSMGADIVIAINVETNPLNQNWDVQTNQSANPISMPEFFYDFYRAASIMMAHTTQTNLIQTPPTLLIEPPIPADVTIFKGFLQTQQIIEYGEIAAQEMLPEIIRVTDSFVSTENQ